MLQQGAQTGEGGSAPRPFTLSTAPSNKIPMVITPVFATPIGKSHGNIRGFSWFSHMATTGSPDIFGSHGNHDTPCGSYLALFYIHQMNRVNSRNDLCHDSR